MRRVLAGVVLIVEVAMKCEQQGESGRWLSFLCIFDACEIIVANAVDIAVIIANVIIKIIMIIIMTVSTITTTTAAAAITTITTITTTTTVLSPSSHSASACRSAAAHRTPDT
jgi:hypothetical protein